ncbi:MAG: SpoIIE family protein phosphatase [Deltaproteobacteria bacterium]|nr:SpoIIE family protein phosphatase [Deltaproteobacteria bacterium]
MSELSNMRVMVVDDTEANIDILLETLADDYKVVVATDGESALEDIEKSPPDLILLDIMMPGMDGYEVCQKLKNSEITRNIPVIFLTALKEEGDEARGLGLGAVDYITKPFNPELVKARVRNHLDLKRHQNHLEELVEKRTQEIAERQRVEYQLRASKEKIESELNIAAQIQRSILPSTFPAFPEHSEFDLYAMMTPAREVGGDFYDFFFVDDDHLALIIADVSDKGVPAALFMMISRTIFRSIAKQRKSPSQILAETNDLLCEGNDTGMFVSAYLAFYHPPTGRLTYSNGGHNPAFLFGSNDLCRELVCKHGTALGVRPGQSYEEYVDKLETGQILVLYTDGVTEACSPDNELFGVDRFTKLVCDCHSRTLSQMFNYIHKDLKSFQQGNQFDDITMLALKREI